MTAMRLFITRKLPPALLGAALALGAAGTPAMEDPYPRLPGEPQVQPAVNGRLTDGEALNLVVDWAKFGKDPSAEKLIDTAITAISIGYPPAGIALGIAKGIVMGLMAGPDPVAEALKIMDKRIAALEKNVTDLAKALSQMHNQMLQIENRIRMTELQRRRDAIADLKGVLSVMREKKPSAREKYEFTKQVERLAARFRPDSEPDNDMWQWSDLRVFTDPATGKLKAEPFPADFKTLPLMEAYLNTLVLLMASIQYEGGDTAYVKKTYHDELMRHVQALSVRPYWQEGEEQITLPERLMSRVNCGLTEFQKYPDKDGTCSVRFARCTDNLARRTTIVGSAIPDWHVNAANTLCTVSMNSLTPTIRPADRADLEQKWEARSDQAPWGTDALTRVRQYSGYTVPAEEVLENFHGLETMTVLADRLYKLAVSGTLMEPPNYSFDHTYWDKEFLYGVKKNGELIWFGHLIGEDRNPPNPMLKYSTTLKGSSTTLSRATTTRGIGGPSAAVRAGSATTISGAAAGPSGRALTATEVQGRAKAIETVVPKPPEFPIVHKWEGPKTVGTGWQNFRDIIPAAMANVTPNVAGASFYAVTTDGALLWYRHDGFVNGETRWKGPVNVGSGWQSFRKIVSAGDGIVYGIGTDGSLRWYRQNDVADAATSPVPVALGAGGGVRSRFGATQIVSAPSHWTGPNVVGSNWGHFVHVFSTGEGVIYAVDPQGKLWWYKHRGYLTGTQDWEGPKQVGNGWAGFKKVFSPSEGYIYALTQGGELLWYQHQGYQDGSVRWRGPTAVGATWGDYAFIFSAMQGTPQAPVVR
jgi:hypothetical protein